ncbi:MAG TPA: acyltransferase family protein [Acidimicrobiia bacterium]|nr:acyltransferase family protein [Acidimicrobiia bacterium]
MASPSSSLAPGVTDVALHHEAWIDHLRVAVIVGVIGAHVSLIYALDVGWYYEERTASEVAKAILAGAFSPGLLFGMGLLFFVAGFFTPPGLERKGARRFVVDRLWRLGVPTVAYLLLVNPAMNFFGDSAMGEGETVGDYFRLTYWDDVELGVAWFMAALLAFSLAYAAWRWRHPVLIGPHTPLRPGDLVKVGVFIAVASFIVRLEFPVLSGDVAWTLNLWEYPQMSALFGLGVHASEQGWLSSGLTRQTRRACGRAATVGVVLAVVVGAGLAITEDPQRFLGGLRFEATLIPLIEATLALGMSLWAIDWFRRRGNRSGTLVRGLGRGSFAAYLVHAPLIILLAIALRDVGLPAELKFLVVFGLGVVASFWLGWLATRSRVAGRIL